MVTVHRSILPYPSAAISRALCGEDAACVCTFESACAVWVAGAGSEEPEKRGVTLGAAALVPGPLPADTARTREGSSAAAKRAAAPWLR